MANKGKDTNNSQFFVNDEEFDRLDLEAHRIFGRVVGGLKVLDRLEDIEADEKNSEKLFRGRCHRKDDCAPKPVDEDGEGVRGSCARALTRDASW